jgi:hypothetical protein
VPFLAVDKMVLGWVCQLFPKSREALAIVRPNTIVRWHRAGFFPGFICSYVAPAVMSAVAILRQTRVQPNISTQPVIRSLKATICQKVGAGVMLINNLLTSPGVRRRITVQSLDLFDRGQTDRLGIHSRQSKWKESPCVANDLIFPTPKVRSWRRCSIVPDFLLSRTNKGWVNFCISAVCTPQI